MLLICIFIFQQTQKQDGGYWNPQNKWNVGSDAFIIAQNNNHKRERGVLLKATLFILTKLKMIDPYHHWRTSTDFIEYLYPLLHKEEPFHWVQDDTISCASAPTSYHFDILTQRGLNLPSEVCHLYWDLNCTQRSTLSEIPWRMDGSDSCSTDKGQTFKRNH